MSGKFKVQRQDIFMDEALVRSEVGIEELVKVMETWQQKGCPREMRNLITASTGNNYLGSIHWEHQDHEDNPGTLQLVVNHIVTTEAGDNFPEGFHIDSSRPQAGAAVGFLS